MTPLSDAHPSVLDSLVHDHMPTEVVALSSLRAADSPRLSGPDSGHIKRLAQTEEGLPPILVHHSTRRVIDGMHRVLAAELRGDQEIEVNFFDGDEESAFILGVQANIAHGLPLSLADRTAATVRILRCHPRWSDRAVARVVGLAHATVGAIRHRMGFDLGQCDLRLGHDGRARALNIAQARRMAGELIAKEPGASLRKIAQQVGISPTTVRDVRLRMSRGDDPVPPKQRRTESVERERGSELTQLEERRRLRRVPPRPAARDRNTRRPAEIWQRLRKDPALRSSERGRALLRWLAIHSSDLEEWPQYLDPLPPHCINPMLEMARGLADIWTALADDLERRATNQP